MEFLNFLIIIFASISFESCFVSGQVNNTGYELLPISSTCFKPDPSGILPNCTAFKLQNSSFEVACLEPNVLRVHGEFLILKIICSAHYPLDLYYYGIQPTEATTIDWYKTVHPGTNRKTEAFNIEIKIHSVNELFDFYSKERNAKIRHDYSRTGNYVFRGIFNKTLATSLFLYLEDSAKPSFLRNERTKITKSGARTFLPCIASHRNATVEVMKVNGHPATEFTQISPFTGFASTTTPIDSQYECIMSFQGVEVDRLLMAVQRNDGGKELPFGAQDIGWVQNGTELDTMVVYSGSLDQERNANIFATCLVSQTNWGKSNMYFANIETADVAYMRLAKQFVLPQYINQSYTARQCENFDDDLLRRLKIKEPFHLRSGISFCMAGDTYELVEYGASLQAAIFKFGYGREWAEFKRDNAEISTHYEIEMLPQEGAGGVVYANTNLTFKCKVNIVVVFKPTIWYTEWKNGSLIEEFIDYDWRGAYSYFTKSLSPDVTAVRCFGSYWYSYLWRNISLPLNVTVGFPPEFNNTEDHLSLRLGSLNHILSCSAHGSPSPRLIWLKNGVKLPHTEIRSGSTTTISFQIPKVDYDQAGNYDCLAENFFGDKTKRVKVEISDDGAVNLGVIIGIAVSVFILTALGAWIYIKYFRKEKVGLTRQEIEEFLKGEQGPNIHAENNEYAHEFAHLTPYTGEYELPDRRFQVDQTGVLGSGAFGVVLRGIVDGVPVAVKTIKRNCEKSYLKALLSELKIMIYIGAHENIVHLIGASTKDLNKGSVYIFVDLCSFGNLEKYLRLNRHNFSESCEYQNFIGTGKGDHRMKFGVGDLIHWSQQIASGMNYLSSKKVIHGDLACRNVLLNENREVKITDFGLSRQLYGYASYVKKNQEPLPWRWMALESLRDLTFSTSSDVWGYGVTVWEIFSLGEVPYPGLTWTIDFVEQLEKGLRLGQPKRATNNIYHDIMIGCWHDNPDERLTFREILDKFSGGKNTESSAYQNTTLSNVSIQPKSDTVPEPAEIRLYMNTSV